MALFDFSTTNIENHYPPMSGISWVALVSTVVGFTLGILSQVILYFILVFRSGRIFKSELADSETAFSEQLTSIYNFKKEISENKSHNLSIMLKQKYKTLLSIDRLRLKDFFFFGWLLFWRRNRKKKNYVTNTFGQIETVVSQMDRLSDYVVQFNADYKKYMKEFVDEHYAIKNLYDILHKKGKSDKTMVFFASLFQDAFFEGDKLEKRRIIDIALLEDRLTIYHFKLEDKLPYDKDDAFFTKVMEYSYRSRALITHLAHCKRQVLADVTLIEATLSETYKELFGKDFVFQKEVAK